MPFSTIIGHRTTIASLQTAAARQRLAHAYLLHGEAAIGKRTTALCFVQALLCERSASDGGLDACGLCRSCHQIDTRTHPDYFLIEPDRELATPQIKIEQIREIEQHLIYRPLIGDRKICMIDDADRLTIGAANALLKTLEEPPDHSLFLLITSRPASLPATIRSRCQALRFATPPRTDVEAALILKREMPPGDARFLAMISEGRLGEALSTDLKAARLQQQELIDLVSPHFLRSVTNLLTAAESLAKADRAADTLSWIARWIRDLIIVQVDGDREQLLHVDQLSTLERDARQAPTDALLDLLREIEDSQQQATRHLNLQMALENILLRLRDAVLSPASQPA
ncbi:MAG TPA: DNA polymerase III subunit delta' [Nitrospira sp.]|jgi:DNA polymerase-3 subunit delta'|nr:DNA polymerase III subunit delta' [Nitrospira sp.]